MAELLFWPALLGYGEAVIAYTSPRHTRLATWGVRIGWLAQTGLLVYQASRVDSFPWASWAGSLNLFVWFTVGAYLIWGCQARYRLVGLTVMPLAVGLFIASRIGGGTTAGEKSHYSNLFLTVHVEPHAYFKREGNDVVLEVPISIPEAVLGGKIDVPTVDGSWLTVKVPPGTSTGSRLRLRGKGVAGGDQYLSFKIMGAPAANERSRELIEEFARLNPQDPRAGLPWT